MSFKENLKSQLVQKLQSEADALVQAAQAAHAAATHEESRAEDQHDTRGIEASYLAGAQAQRAAELQTLVSLYRMMSVAELGAQDPVAPGAWVQLEQIENRRKSQYLMVPRGGGVTLEGEGGPVLVIAPSSPLGEALLGRRLGDDLEVESQGGVREYRVIGVR